MRSVKGAHSVVKLRTTATGGGTAPTVTMNSRTAFATTCGRVRPEKLGGFVRGDEHTVDGAYYVWEITARQRGKDYSESLRLVVSPPQISEALRDRAASS